LINNTPVQERNV